MKRLLLRLFAACMLLLPQAAGAAFPFDLTKLAGSPESVPSETKKLPEEAEVLKLRDATFAEYQQAEQALKIPESAPESEGQFLRNRLQSLERLGLVYNELLETFGTLGRVDARLKEIEGPLNEWRSGTPPKNYVADFAALDKLRGQEVEAQKSIKSRDQIYKARQEALEEAKKNFTEAESERRKAKEALESASTPEEKTAGDQRLSLTQLNSRTAETQIQLRDLELQVSKRYRQLSDKQRELAAYQTVYLEKRVVFDKAALDTELESIHQEQARLEESIVKAQSGLSSISKEYAKARRNLDLSPTPPMALVEQVEARRLEQSQVEQQIEFYSERVKDLKERERLWKQRFELLSGKADSGQIRVWQEQTGQILGQIQRDEELVSLRLNSARNALAETQQKLISKADADSETQGWIRRQQEYLQKSLEGLQEQQASLVMARKLEEKFQFEQQQRVSHVSAKDRLKRVWDSFLRFWNFELTSVDDSPITVGKILVALILVLFGSLLARRLSRVLAEKVLPRFGVSSGVAAALRTLSFYLLFLFFFIVALNVVRVPLTLFAVLGGAIAIGIGFGSQNLMNNFISGLILLIERPIKVGDIIQMEQATGMVEHIGGRSTQIRTADNTQFIIPNSSFLEKPVINWTLSDDMIRSVIRVGSTYGSNTRKVAELLKKAAESHGKILKTPPPVVSFSDFGADALIFDLFFWVRIRSLGERREIESDLRFMIDNLFREAEITLAYPQRDVHLHASAPLEVKISRDS